MVYRFAALLVVLSVSVVLAQLEPVAVAVDQPTAPLRITEFTAEHTEANRGGQFTAARLEGIRYEVKLQSTSDQKIVAYRMGFVAFNVFNEFISRFGGYSVNDIDPGEEENGAWQQSRSNSSIFTPESCT